VGTAAPGEAFLSGGDHVYWLFAMFGALALIDISLELTKIRKVLERESERRSNAV